MAASSLSSVLAHSELWLTEQLLSGIPGVTFTLINPGIFADPILQMLPLAANIGVIPNLFSGLRTPSPSNEDMGRCVAAALIYPEKYADKRYRPTSPQALDMTEMAEIIGKVLGRTVKVQTLPAKMFLKAARVAGAGDFEITNVQHYIQESDLHVFDTHGPTTDVLELSGREPESFETIVRRYAFCAAISGQQSQSNRGICQNSDYTSTEYQTARCGDGISDAAQPHPRREFRNLATAT